MKTIMNESLEAFDQIDIMIHAVGSIVLKPLHVLKVEEFHETLNLNLISAFNALKCVIRPMMRKKHGSVVFISSVAGSTGLMNHEAISAAKGGLEAMIRSAAITYAKRGVRINGVALGLVNTPLSKKLTNSETALKASEKLHPLGRIGGPKDVIPAVLYLASDESSWVTGEIIHVDGGISAGK
jgi:NAD(P)-dependent dehydrogenase (short-subunit alcohol dehydrogenase family)